MKKRKRRERCLMEKSIELINMVAEQVKKVVVGKDYIIDKILTVILAKGHILIEDIPGVGKTTLALAFAKAMDLKQNRLQFTPDVLPTDVVGYSIINNLGEEIYKPGAIMCNIFLADEINRTSSKTQSALLEVMEEGKVTVDQVTREVPKPFVVIATQNPIGSIGTQMLPESQLDRFMVRLTIGYPDLRSEVNLLKDRRDKNPLDMVDKVIGETELEKIQSLVEDVYIHDALYEYMAWLSGATRNHALIDLGVSPRGTIALMNMVKASAFLKGRDYVIPDDIKGMFYDVVSHRIILSSKAKLNHIRVSELLEDILRQTKVPTVARKNA